MSKLTMPKGRKEWAKTILVALLLFIVVSVFVGAPYAGWWPAYGRSAWPTMKWWTWYPYLSGYYHVNYKDRDPEPGDIVWFWVPDHWPQTEVKRVEKVEIQGGESCMWLAADNAGITGEGSDFSDRYDWVPTRLVIGTIDDIWTPTRWARSRTPTGRLRNWVALHCSPSDWGYVGEYTIYATNGDVNICKGGSVVTSFPGEVLSRSVITDAKVRVIRGEEGVFEVDGRGRLKRISWDDRIAAAEVVIGETKLVVGGVDGYTGDWLDTVLVVSTSRERVVDTIRLTRTAGEPVVRVRAGVVEVYTGTGPDRPLLYCCTISNEGGKWEVMP